MNIVYRIIRIRTNLLLQELLYELFVINFIFTMSESNFPFLIINLQIKIKFCHLILNSFWRHSLGLRNYRLQYVMIRNLLSLISLKRDQRFFFLNASLRLEWHYFLAYSLHFRSLWLFPFLWWRRIRIKTLKTHGRNDRFRMTLNWFTLNHTCFLNPFSVRFCFLQRHT